MSPFVACPAQTVYGREKRLPGMKRGQMCYLAAMLPPKKWTVKAQIRSRNWIGV